MVKGISKQVIVVEGNNRDLYDSAIFILKSSHANEGVDEKELLRQAKTALTDFKRAKCNPAFANALWAFGGFAISSGIWLLSVLL